MAKGRKTGGRVRGTPNKATAEARAVAIAFLQRRTDREIDALWKRAKYESPTKALAMWLGAMEFVMPKLGRTEHVGDQGGPIRAAMEVAFVDPPTSR